MLPRAGRRQQILALLHLVHRPGEDGFRLFHVANDRVHQMGDGLDLLSSTTLGSIILNSSIGRDHAFINMLRMIALMQTDLPVPVAPAMSRCGISASRVRAVGLRRLSQGTAESCFWRSSSLKRGSLPLGARRRAVRWVSPRRRCFCRGSDGTNGRSMLVNSTRRRWPGPSLCAGEPVPGPTRTA